VTQTTAVGQAVRGAEELQFTRTVSADVPAAGRLMILVGIYVARPR